MPQHKKRSRPDEVLTFILDNLDSHPGDITTHTATTFNLSRQAINKYLVTLTHQQKISARGNTRARRYYLNPIVDKNVRIDTSVSEDQLWRKFFAEPMHAYPDEIFKICQYGFCEMFNNVLDHSETQNANVTLRATPSRIAIEVRDYGVGIFRKIQAALGLEDPRFAILELEKGKFTTDPNRHSGEGIFFTSRLFPKFIIFSGKISYWHKKTESNIDSDWLIDNDYIDWSSSAESLHNGTYVMMEIPTSSTTKMTDVFDYYIAEGTDSFSKTKIAVSLTKIGNENLVSRSQARRLLSRFDQFREVILDFTGIESIGQAFADEIFRVFKISNPRVNVIAVNTNDEVRRMIDRVTAVPS